MTEGRARAERGFTIIEVLIALLVLLVGMAGILSLQLTSVEATAFSRHATEASVLAESKMELLRTQPLASLSSGSEPEPIDALGQPPGIYDRSWEVTVGTPTTIEVQVTWKEQGGGDDYTISLRTQRAE